LKNKRFPLYLTTRFPIVFGGVAVLFALSFGFEQLFVVAQVALVLALVVLVWDAMVLLFAKPQQFLVTREVGKILSLGDAQDIVLKFSCNAPRPFRY
jgi:hypothetical protein